MQPQSPQGNTMLAMTETDPAKQKIDKKLIILVACGVVTLLSIVVALFSFVESGKKTAEINKLKRQITNGEEIVIGNETISVGGRSKNPVLSATYPEIYNIDYNSREYAFDDGANYTFSFTIRDGKVISCAAKKLYDSVDGYTEDNKQCSINNISSNIYKVIDITDSGNPEEDLLAFLLDDGTIDFVKVYAGLKNMQFNIAGKIDAGGFVTDVMNVKLFQQNSLNGKDATIFTLSDGNFVQYKKSMLHYN